MAESKPDPSHHSISDMKAKAHNLFGRAKEEMGEILHTEKLHLHLHRHHKDIDENTSLSDVKAPNVVERAKEEIEALVQTIHHKKRDESEIEKADSKSESKVALPENDMKAPNLIERAKEEVEAILHHNKSQDHHQHHKETHGMRDDIDENTSLSEVKAPNVFERAKEEVEALIQTIHLEEERTIPISSPKEEGFMTRIGRMFEKLCSPWGTKRD